MLVLKKVEFLTLMIQIYLIDILLLMCTQKSLYQEWLQHLNVPHAQKFVEILLPENITLEGFQRTEEQDLLMYHLIKENNPKITIYYQRCQNKSLILLFQHHKLLLKM